MLFSIIKSYKSIAIKWPINEPVIILGLQRYVIILLIIQFK